MVGARREVIAESLSLTKSFQGYQGLSVSWLSVEWSKLAVRRVYSHRLLRYFSLLYHRV